ncbi:uncharacterized protein LOC127277781 [Leptopilina boulardi]|uniref:uncharacterized protein LOC127277781 n=1 Tax=Leptopilina boulardi TaxID=63433 RepID=UPI0021F509E2|nr:uncharacterized protein LOC127277781 [Leptopilina boulardi]
MSMKNEKTTKNLKRTRDEASWERNKVKSARNLGQAYTSKSGVDVAEKKFVPVEEICCKKECFRFVDGDSQRDLFESFWKSGDYVQQNAMIAAGLMKKKRHDPLSADSKREDWNYYFSHPLYDERVAVCRKFLLKLLHLSQGRFYTVQQKMLAGEILIDKRGKHKKHVVKLTDMVKDLILKHCESLPHSSVCYKTGEVKINYFDDPALNLKRLYESFLDYYAAITENSEIPLNLSTYSYYFNQHVNYSFRPSMKV